MADELKTQGDLKLDVPKGLNAHLLVMSWNDGRPHPGKSIEKVGYWRATPTEGQPDDGSVGESVWFDVDGDLAKAQAVINDKVVPALKELAPKRTEAEAKADKAADEAEDKAEKAKAAVARPR